MFFFKLFTVNSYIDFFFVLIFLLRLIFHLVLVEPSPRIHTPVAFAVSFTPSLYGWLQQLILFSFGSLPLLPVHKHQRKE